MTYKSGGTLRGPLRFEGTSAPTLSSSNEGRFYYDTTTNQFLVSQDGSAYVPFSGSVTTLAPLTGANASIGTALRSVAVGVSASVGNGSDDSVALGNGAAASGANSRQVVIGSAATGGAPNSVTIGTSSFAGSSSVVVGTFSTGSGADYSTALGFQASVLGRTNSIALGANATATGDNQFVVGGDTVGTNGVTDGYFGNGVADALPTSFTLHATGSSAAGITGATLTLAGGLASSGDSAAGGSLFLATQTNGAASLTNRVQVSPAGNVILNASGAALVTASATDGWTYLPTLTTAGPPVQPPTSIVTGAMPVVVGSAGSLYGYYAGAWNAIGGGGGGSTLQSAYAASPANPTPAISTTAGKSIIFSNSTDTTNLLTLERSFAGAGTALSVSMGATSTGNAVSVAMASGATGLSFQGDSSGNGGGISVPGTGTGSERFGSGATAGGNFSLSVGNGATAASTGGVALGASASSSLGGIAIGYQAVAGGSQLVIGGGVAVAHAYIGNGVQNLAPQDVTIHSTSSGSDTVSGAALTLMSGNAAAGGSAGSSSGAFGASTPNAAAGTTATAYSAGAMSFTVGNSAALGVAQAAGSGIGFTAGNAASGTGGAAANGGGFLFQVGNAAGGGTQGQFVVNDALGVPFVTFDGSTHKVTFTGAVDPTQVLLTGADKRFGATDAGPVYLAPFANATSGVQVRRADNTTVVLDVDTLNQRVGIGTTTPTQALHVTGSVQVDTNAVISGNLTVNGTTTTINTTNLTITDPLIYANAGAVAPSFAAVAFNQGGGANLDKLLLWNSTSTRFELGSFNTVGGTVVPSTGLTTLNDLLVNNLSLAGPTITGSTGFDLNVNASAGKNAYLASTGAGNTQVSAGNQVVLSAPGSGGGFNILMNSGPGSTPDILLNSRGADVPTTATQGFLSISACNGIPTGTPSNLITGAVPIIVDHAGGVLYGYFGGAWTSLSGAGGGTTYAIAPSGGTATATGTNAFAAGQGASATGTGATAFGVNAAAVGLSVGAGSNSGNSATALGVSANASGTNSVVVGSSASDSGCLDSVVIGTGTSAGTGGSSSTIIGYASQGAGGAHSVIVGWNMIGGGNYSVALGDSSIVSGTQTIGLGANQIVSSSQSIILGHGGQSTFNYSIGLGYFVKPTAANQFVLGGDDGSGDGFVNQVVLGGNGPANASQVPVTWTTSSVLAGTADTAGASISISGSQGTGLGAGGAVSVKTAPAASATGTTQNALVTRSIWNPVAKALTSGTAANLVRVALPTGTMAGGELRFVVRCTDGTDFQALSGALLFTCVNKAGAITSYAPSIIGTNVSTTGLPTPSTLTVTASTAVNVAGFLDVQLTATTSLTPTTFDVQFIVENSSTQDISIL